MSFVQKASIRIDGHLTVDVGLSLHKPPSRLSLRSEARAFDIHKTRDREWVVYLLCHADILRAHLGPFIRYPHQPTRQGLAFKIATNIAAWSTHIIRDFANPFHPLLHLQRYPCRDDVEPHDIQMVPARQGVDRSGKQAVLTPGGPLKGAISAVIGLMLATVGSDVLTGSPRFHFGSIYLLDGIDFLSSPWASSRSRRSSKASVNLQARAECSPYGGWNRLFPRLDDLRQSFWPCIRATILGFFIGILPGAGATIASFLSYATEKRISKQPDRFGKGAVAGIAGPEAANNAATGGSMVPMLALGIPGSNVTAVMLGALIMLGVAPGPMLFQENPTFVWGLVASMYVGNLMLLVLNIPLIGIFVQILRLRFAVLAVLVLELSLVGVFAIGNNFFDLHMMVLFGVIGYSMKRLDFPMPPLILALVLGKVFEVSFRRSLIISEGDPSIFLTRPISLVLLLIAVLVFCYPLILESIRKARSR